MNPLLEQFIAEARECLQGIGTKLMQLEQAPGDADLMAELFRLVHTLKGNSGLFDFPEMTRVLHAGEDLMDAVRNGAVGYSQELADQLLDAMDFVGLLCDDIESDGAIAASRAEESARLAQALRALIASTAADAGAASEGATVATAEGALPLAEVPQSVRQEACRRAIAGDALHWIVYRPEEGCFFHGDDPFFTVRQVPGTLWGRIVSREAWAPLAELDAYRCVLEFQLLSAAPRAELVERFRYVPEQVSIVAIDPQLVAESLETPTPEGSNEAAFVASSSSAPVATASGVALSPEAAATLKSIFAAQRQVLLLEDNPAWLAGRLKAAAAVLGNCCKACGDAAATEEIEAALQQALAASSSAPLLAWLEARAAMQATPHEVEPSALDDDVRGVTPDIGSEVPATIDGGAAAPEAVAVAAATEEGQKFGRRAEDAVGSKSLRVDQARIDRLMNLIGEMVVAKNAMPYLAQRAEDQYGERELSREIKAQYAVINRIAEEMQDAIMQVRMMPVSFIFQRFPRLVRDISRKLGKEVQLVLEGEETEADKNIIESLADPLMHIVRNSLDHGLETAEVRKARGKPAAGTLTIRAANEGDQVLIEISDDGQGIDPAVIKHKAYEKGVIDEATLERITDREAINLVFAPGFSTAEVISDLSGRGVGMDVVRTAVEKVNGSIALDSEVGKGTRIRILLPLSMAVTKVMVIESDGQIFGVPMDHVVETVRVPRSAIRRIKQSESTVLRGNIVPLRSLNALLGLASEQKPNADDEMAVLVARAGGEMLGLIVDDFHETVGIIQKRLDGVLSGLAAYSGSALMGDGSVLMVLNVRELV